MFEEKRRIDLQLFNNTQTTLLNNNTTPPLNDLSPEMKTYYSDYLIDNAVPNLVHDQFGQKHPIPKNGGKTIEFRKYDPFPKATTPITEGVTPNGHKLNVTTITATVNQYGDYVELSDVLLLTAIDNNMVQATKLLGNQAGETLDWVTREVLSGGTNVLYAKGTSTDPRPTSRAGIKAANTLSVDDIFNAVRILKNANAKKIDNSFIGIVCPDIAYTLMRSSEWIDVHKYAQPTEIYEGELGKIGGVRFVETTEAKIFGAGAKLNDNTISVYGAHNKNATSLVIDGATFAADAWNGKTIQVGNFTYEVTDQTATENTNHTSTLTLKEGLKEAVADNTVLYPAGGGYEGRDVYSTLILGANAYGVTEIAGGGLQHIVKQLGSSGSADPLNQRATVGWKAIKTAERLVESYMVRIESSAAV